MAINKEQDLIFMQEALMLARHAYDQNELPIGAVVVCDGQIVGRGFNQKEGLQDPTAHAEILAISKASANLNRWRLSGCTLYVTLEPCFMCAGAVVNSRIDRLVFAAFNLKAGYVGSLMNICQDSRLNHRCLVESGYLASDSASLLKSFFKRLR